MNRKNIIIGLAIVAVAAVLSALAATETGDLAARFVGKAVWYVPYAALIGALRCFAMA